MDEENEYGRYDDVNDWETEQCFQDQEREYDEIYVNALDPDEWDGDYEALGFGD